MTCLWDRFSTAAHSRIVGVGAKVLLSALSIALGALHLIPRLNLPLHDCILIVHIPLKLLKDLEALVVSHLLGDIDGTQSIAVLLLK